MSTISTRELRVLDRIGCLGDGVLWDRFADPSAWTGGQWSHLFVPAPGGGLLKDARGRLVMREATKSDDPFALILRVKGCGKVTLAKIREAAWREAWRRWDAAKAG